MSSLELRRLLERRGLTTVAGAFALEAAEDLGKPGLGHRRRSRVALSDGEGGSTAVYLKRYDREPLAAAVRRWIAYGPGCGPAGVEARNIELARAAGLTDMEVLAWGQEGPACWPARSFLVVSEVAGQSLERCGQGLARQLDQPAIRALLTEGLADLVARLHRAGYVHRDLYACHIFFMQRGDSGDRLSLIDLARMFRPRCRAFRWQVKDLAQLRYSMPPAWVAGCWEEFLRAYLRRRGGGEEGRYNRAIARKAAAMARRARRREPP